MGPDKSGKSMWLGDLAYRAVRNRRRVAYFDAGDMTQEDVLLRMGERCTRTPRQPGVLKIPTGFDDERKPVFEERVVEEGLTPSQAFKAFRKLSRGRDLFRLICFPNSTIDVDGLESILQDWERGGWVADVMAIDYADILAPPKGIQDPLDQIDATWRHLRRMSQRWRCLVVTATQSNAAAYSQKVGMLTRRHFSGRKTKLAHVNGMVGINRIEDSEVDFAMLNWVVRREAGFSPSYRVPVAGCLAIASPAVFSV